MILTLQTARYSIVGIPICAITVLQSIGQRCYDPAGFQHKRILGCNGLL
jgi:hypothetical protein